MYCKYCGKEIAEDSAFCQYCGGQLQGDIHEKTKQPIPLLKRFQSLSKGWQIATMVYIIWFLAALCVLVGFGPYDTKWNHYKFIYAFYHFLLTVVGGPLLVLFVWYYFARLRSPKKTFEKVNDGVVGSGQTISESIVQRNTTSQSTPKEINAFSLLDFAKQHGKMQVKTVATPTTNEVRSYCVFTNEQGKETKVYFSQKLGPLRPQEIAERKEQLVVVQKMDGTFELE